MRYWTQTTTDKISAMYRTPAITDKMSKINNTILYHN